MADIHSVQEATPIPEHLVELSLIFLRVTSSRRNKAVCSHSTGVIYLGQNENFARYTDIRVFYFEATCNVSGAVV